MVISLPKVSKENKVHLERYKKFIKSRPKRNLKKEKGFHIHHIVPKSLGGKEDKSNKIKLSYREHYIAHMILWKTGYKEMVNAFWIINVDKRNYECKITSRQYKTLQEGRSILMSNKYKGKGNPMYGKDWREGKTEKEIKEHHKKCSCPGVNNPMYGRSAYLNLSLKEYKKVIEKKKESMKIVWNMKRKMEEESLQVRCIQTQDVFDSFNEASNKIYESNRHVKHIIESILNKSFYRNYSWEFVNV